jgi:hypothetical protein
VSNGDSDSGLEQETSLSDFGTKLTVDLGEIELTEEQRENISSEIIRVIIERIGMPHHPEVEYYRRGYRRGRGRPPGSPRSPQ